MLDKLASDVLGAKLDSLEVLVHGASVYGATTLSSHAELLWVALKTQVRSTKFVFNV